MKRYSIRSIIVLVLFLMPLSFSASAESSNERKGIKAIHQERNEKKKFYQLRALGEKYKTTNIQKADSLCVVLLDKSKQLDYPEKFSTILYSAELACQKGNRQQYVQKLRECQRILPQLKMNPMVYTLYHHLGLYYSSKGALDSARFYFNAASKIPFRYRNKAHVAEQMNFIALGHMLQNNKDSALFYTDMALKYGKRSSGRKMVDECLHMQATIYAHFGQVELSLAKYLLAMDWAQKTGDIFHLASYYRAIGQMQSSIRNTEDAVYYYTNAYNCSRQINDYRQMGLSLLGLGYVHYQRLALDTALMRIHEAKLLLHKYNDPEGLGEAYHYIGLIHLEKKAFLTSKINLLKALDYIKASGRLERVANIYHDLGLVFFRQKKFPESLHYLKHSITNSTNRTNDNFLYKNYRLMAKVYRELKQPVNALHYLEKYTDYIDSSSVAQSTQKMADLSKNYRSEQRFRLIQMQADSIKQQVRIKELTDEKLKNSELINTFQRYIIIGLFLLVLFAGIIYFYRTNQVKIKQQQKEAEMAQTLLRTQMNPHFVFNAMSVIQSYIYENDPMNSTKFLVNFSRLMRLILENSSKEFILLETEMEILKKYMEIQKLRFEDRFDYTIRVSEDILPEHVIIPPMITQPFIENAIEHGRLERVEGGYILVGFRRLGKILEITVEDNGVGRTVAEQHQKESTHKSMAINITRERIAHLNKKYGTEGNLEVEDLDKVGKTGTKVLIWLPYKEKNFLPEKT